ncbi:Nampt, partial [Symbiodinium necroappetens]
MERNQNVLERKLISSRVLWRQQHDMKEQLELQRAELQQLSTELEKAHAALQQQRGELNREVEKYEPCSTEPEVARFMVSAEQETADELRQRVPDGNPENDDAVKQLLRRYADDPVYLVFDVNEKTGAEVRNLVWRSVKDSGQYAGGDEAPMREGSPGIGEENIPYKYASVKCRQVLPRLHQNDINSTTKSSI